MSLNVFDKKEEDLKLFTDYTDFFKAFDNSLSPILLLVAKIFFFIAIFLIIIQLFIVLFGDKKMRKKLKMISLGTLFSIIVIIFSILVIGIQKYEINVLFITTTIKFNFSIGFYLLLIPLLGAIYSVLSNN